MQKLCQQYNVSRLEVCGSAAQADKFDSQQSDLDFLVEFKPLEMGQHPDIYFGLRESLEKLFHREVDLVMTCAIKKIRLEPPVHHGPGRDPRTGRG